MSFDIKKWNPWLVAVSSFVFIVGTLYGFLYWLCPSCTISVWAMLTRPIKLPLWVSLLLLVGISLLAFWWGSRRNNRVTRIVREVVGPNKKPVQKDQRVQEGKYFGMRWRWTYSSDDSIVPWDFVAHCPDCDLTLRQVRSGPTMLYYCDDCEKRIRSSKGYDAATNYLKRKVKQLNENYSSGSTGSSV